jgi:hypothetical protein
MAQSGGFLMNEWQPIDTAPSNHFPVLTWSIGQGRCVAFLDVNFDWWSIPLGQKKMKFKPTHWMPLPEPPKATP